MVQLQLNDLTFFYPGQTVPALSKVNLTVERGEFLVLCGPSGSGKSTLLRLLKPALAPHGRVEGARLWEGRPLEELDRREQAQSIGFVLQSPEEQIVTDKVWHELAFGLESLGYSQTAIRARVAEMAAFFGLEGWFHRDTASLSGGQKQLLNLAAVMALGPQVLLLDEPTSQLDPMGAQSFLDCLGRVNRELGTTVVLCEHRLEEALPLAGRCGVLDRGRLLVCAPPRETAAYLRNNKHPMASAMPTPVRVWAATEGEGDCPLTVGEGRNWLSGYAQGQSLTPPPLVEPFPETEPALEAREVWFGYRREEPVLRGLSLRVPVGSLCALMGGNGAGKSTLLHLLARGNRPQKGELRLLGRPLEDWSEPELFQGALALLPQDPKALFVGRTVEEDLAEVEPSREARADLVRLCRLEHLLSRHPYDLSGGEQQRAALTKVLLTRPRVLLLDEPTKGMDQPFREELAQLLTALRKTGVTLLMVSHDIEFCARCATHCALLFDGGITAWGEPRDFFAQNSFYSTAACRMARDLVPGVITPQQLIAACGGAEAAAQTSQASGEPEPAQAPRSTSHTPPPNGRRSPISQRLGLLALVICLAAGVLAWRGVPWLAGLASGAWLPSLLWLGAAAAALWLLGLGRQALARPKPARVKGEGRWLTALFLLVLCPLTLLAGMYLLKDRKYYFISLLVLLEALIPLLLKTERRAPPARELVVLSVLIALAVAGRGALFMLPQFKPVVAVVIVAGVALGGQGGFLVGAGAMLVSNFFYVQGAWTPWQMAGAGLIGLLAGWLAPMVGRNRVTLCLFGFVSTVVVYGGLLNTASLLMFQPNPTWEMLAASLALGFPLDLVHGAATAFFLWAAGPALLEKLERVKLKYGLNGPE